MLIVSLVFSCKANPRSYTNGEKFGRPSGILIAQYLIIESGRGEANLWKNIDVSNSLKGSPAKKIFTA